jgi:hypothetical protein
MLLDIKVSNRYLSTYTMFKQIIKVYYNDTFNYNILVHTTRGYRCGYTVFLPEDVR